MFCVYDLFVISMYLQSQDIIFTPTLRVFLRFYMNCQFRIFFLDFLRLSLRKTHKVGRKSIHHDVGLLL